MCLKVRREASGWRCETVQRVKLHLLQIDRQTGRQLGPFQARGTSGKLDFSSLVPVSRAELIVFVFLREEGVRV